jgi:hypothetical protein
MSEPLAEIVQALILGYLGLGLVLLIPGQTRWMARLDPATIGAGLGFRLVTLPGMVLLWPVLLLLVARRRGRSE